MKSKRRKSRACFKDDETTSSIAKRAKLTPATEIIDNQCQQNNVVRHISNFLSSKDNQSIQFLLTYLESNEVALPSYSGNFSITRQDCATLLLPWSIAHLMRSNTTDEENVWRTLFICLNLLVDCTESSIETTLSNCLSQSTLVKLVHKAASSAFVGGDTKNQEYSSNCFVKLMKRYRPSFEIGCNTLLKDIEDLVYASLDKDDCDYCEVALPRHQYGVVCGALRLIHTLLNGANVKRSFAILSSVEMLPRLGRLGFVKCVNSPHDVPTFANNDQEDATSVVEKIIIDGLFHSTHHMDGFRTMDELRSLPKLAEDGKDEKMGDGSSNDTRKSGGKGCYQSGLFQSLRIILSVTPNVDNVKPAHSTDVVATVNLLPALVHGFFDSIHCKQNTASSSIKSSTEADAKLQFYFWAHATISAFRRVLDVDSPDTNLDLGLLKMASETLHMILERDVYSPSYSDSDEALVSFLKFVTQRILGHSHIQECNSTSPSFQEKRSSYILTSIRALLLLNHRLVFEQLPTCIFFACYSLHQFRNKNVSLEAVALLFTIVKTFSELRQIGHFLSSTRTAFSRMEISKESMQSFLLCRKMIDQLSISYQTLPSTQLKEIWAFFDEWIVSISRDGLSSSTSEKLGFASSMFILYIKSIRTDKHNSSELRILCEKSSVGELLDSDRSGVDISESGNCRLGIYINMCGWLVDIHTRSCFWLENIDTGSSAFLLMQTSKDDQKPTVLSYLRDVATETVESEHFKQEQSTFNYQVESQSNVDTLMKASSASLVRLALHRIHQLHSMIYYCKVQEHERKDRNNDTSSTMLKYEAKLLVNFMVYTARTFRCSSDAFFESESLWSNIASSLGTWSHYSEPHHMRVFLNWFFSVLCQIDDKDISQQDKDCVLTLTRDASFYEVRECMTMLIQEGTAFVLNKASGILPILRQIFNSSSDITASSCLNIASQMKIVKSSDMLSERTVQGVNVILSFLSGAPLDLLFCEENTKLVDRAVAIDVLVCKMYKMAMISSKNMVNTLTKTMCTARYLLIVLVPKALFSRESDLIMTTATHIIESSLLLNESRILWPSGNAMCELLTTCIDYYDNDSSPMLELLLKMKQVVEGVNNTTSPTEFTTRAYLMRSLIHRIITLHRRYSFPSKALKPCIEIALLCRHHIWGKIIQHINSASEATAISLLLASDILIFLGNDELVHSNPDLVTHDIAERTMKDAEEIFYMITRTRNSNQDSSNPTSKADYDAAVGYFLSSLASVDAIVSVISNESFMNALLSTLLKEEGTLADQTKSGLDCRLLESALCSLLRKSTMSDIQFIVSFLLPSDKAVKPNYSFTARIYNLLIHCGKSQEHVQILSSQSIPLFLTSMNLLTDEQNGNSYEQFASNIELCSTLMSSLIPRKDLLLMSGQEITMICGRMSSIFKRKQTDDIDAVREYTIFKSCCSVVSSLISNYPKQLYGCPNGLFSLLLAMLNCILRSNSKRSLSALALEYAKICELLIQHKEVFKKHTVGLILRFIRSLKSGMTQATKSILMSSIHYLLDMCSDYEMRQINAMIDAPSKALFAPVFQSYKKYYQYHGV